VAPARRRRLHQRIGQRLERGYGDRAAEIATQLAFHFEAGGDVARADPYLEEAAARAAKRCAPREAAELLEHGLELLDASAPSPERTLRTIRLALTLGFALQSQKGWAHPDVERAYVRALTLSEETDDTPQLFQALAALVGLYVVRAQLARASETATQLEALMTRMPLPAFVFFGELSLGMVKYHTGALPSAREHLERALAFEDIPSSRPARST
jgi:predicted ATPase